MRILFTSFTYHPQTNGVSIVVRSLAEGLYRHGHEVCVATRKNGLSLPDKEVINGVTICRFDFDQTLLKRDIGDYQSYIDFVIACPKDVLVLECVQCQTTDIILPYLDKIQCKIILHSHGGPGLHQRLLKWDTNIKHTIGNTYNWFLYRHYYNKILPSVSNRIDITICLSLCSSDLEYMLLHMREVHLLPNAADDLFFDSSSYKLNTNSVLQLRNKKYLLCISNYTANKNQLAILRAYDKLDDPNYALVFIGSNPTEYSRLLEAKAKRICEKGRKEVKILYGIPRYYFPSIISNAEVFMMASEHEEYPVSLVEAMAVGTPFVCTDAGCSRILPGGVTVRSTKELSTFVKMLEKDESLKQRLCDQGRNYSLANNTVETVIKKFEGILLSL